jgi:hypothetical protein
MSGSGLRLALAATLAGMAGPSAAFDDISQPAQGVTFYVSLPLDAPGPKRQPFSAGLMLQGKRQHEAFHLDSRLFNNFFGTGIEAKWVIAGVVAAGAAVAVAGKSKSTTQQYQEQQQQQQQQQAIQEQQIQQQQSQQQSGGPNGPSAPCPVTPSCP